MIHIIGIPWKCVCVFFVWDCILMKYKWYTIIKCNGLDRIQYIQPRVIEKKKNIGMYSDRQKWSHTIICFLFFSHMKNSVKIKQSLKSMINLSFHQNKIFKLQCGVPQILKRPLYTSVVSNRDTFIPYRTYQLSHFQYPWVIRTL